MASSARIIQSNSAWFQKKINLRPQHRGVHLITEEILRQVPELSQFAMGLCHLQSKIHLSDIILRLSYLIHVVVFSVRTTVLHTSASLALNESWDPDVRDDMEMMLNKIVPEGLPYRHSCEGPDDMVSNVLWVHFRTACIKSIEHTFVFAYKLSSDYFKSQHHKYQLNVMSFKYSV